MITIQIYYAINLQRVNFLHHILAHRVSWNFSAIEIAAKVVRRHVRLLIEVVGTFLIHRLVGRRSDGGWKCRLGLDEGVVSLGRILRIAIDLICLRTRR